MERGSITVEGGASQWRGREDHSGEGGREHRKDGAQEEEDMGGGKGEKERKGGRMGRKEGRGRVGERLGVREGHREDQREDGSNDYLSAPDSLLDTQGPILSPTEGDRAAELALCQGCLPSISFALPAAPSECPLCPVCPAGGTWIISLDK